jgi:hypothetical protein
MKHFLKSKILFFSALVFTITSCHKEEGVTSGKVEFSILSKSISGGRVMSLGAVILSVEDANGNSIFERKSLTLYSFGDQYLSEPVSLPKGNFKLTEFLVVDTNNTVIYATPLEGSPLAYLVSDPLPIDFSIAKDQTTKVSPEVIKVDGQSGLDFGYATFSFNIVNTIQFSIGVLAYNKQTTNFELTNSHLTITANVPLFDNDLPAVTNDIRVKDGYDTYTLTVTKPGYLTSQKTYSAAELKSYTGKAPIVVTLLSESLSNGLLAYYPFSGNAMDATLNNYNGTLHGGVALTSDRKGTANSAYSFDGIDDYISVAHADPLNLVGDFSISLWTSISSSQVLSGSSQANINDIIRKWNGNAEGYPFAIAFLNSTNPNPNSIITGRYDGQICGNFSSYISPAIPTETFIHIALVKEGSKLRQYVNNVLLSEVNDPTQNSGCTVGNTADITIGVRGNLYRYFKGKIDDIRIYNRALTSDEIGNLYAE